MKDITRYTKCYILTVQIPCTSSPGYLKFDDYLLT